jgi:hypothetical protein
LEWELGLDAELTPKLRESHAVFSLTDVPAIGNGVDGDAAIVDGVDLWQRGIRFGTGAENTWRGPTPLRAISAAAVSAPAGGVSLAQNATSGALEIRPSRRIYLVIGGQSNGDGRGALSAPPRALPGVLTLRKDNLIVPAAEPTGLQAQGWVNKSPVGIAPGLPQFSAGVTLANRLTLLTGADVVLIPCAIGSTDLSDAQWGLRWNQNPPDQTTLFGQMRYRIDLATGGDYAGLMFYWVGHEGEAPGSDADISVRRSR